MSDVLRYLVVQHFGVLFPVSALAGWMGPDTVSPRAEEESVHPSGQPRRHRAARARALLVVGVLGALMLAAPGVAGAASGALGTPHPAKGSPVTLGMISDGGSGLVE